MVRSGGRVAAPRNRKHVILGVGPTAEACVPRARKIKVAKPPAPESRSENGTKLVRALEAALIEAHRRRAAAGIEVHGANPGLYLQFASQPGVALHLASLEDARQGIELLAVTYGATEEVEPRRIERATVFVPEGKGKHFAARFETYAKSAPRAKGERRHEAMLDPVAALRLANLRGLWTDSSDVYPAGPQAIWWRCGSAGTMAASWSDSRSLRGSSTSRSPRAACSSTIAS